VIALYVGDRRHAQRLGTKIPEAYRQPVTFGPAPYVVYEGVIPAAQHCALRELARTTHHREH
jgi:hypothetical protein